MLIWIETISGQKAVIVQGMQEEVNKGFIEQNDRVRSATFKGRTFFRPSSYHEWMNLIIGHCYFCWFGCLA